MGLVSFSLCDKADNGFDARPGPARVQKTAVTVTPLGIGNSDTLSDKQLTASDNFIIRKANWECREGEKCPIEL